MSNYKKQHFIPQVLQGFFSKDSKTIGCFHIGSAKCHQSPITNTAQKDWYYKANNTDKTSIEHAFSNIEKGIKPILQRIQNRSFGLEQDELDLLFVFVVAQLMRTPKAASAMETIIDYCINKEIDVVCEEVNSGLRNKANLPMQAAIAIPSIVESLSGKGYLFVSNDTDTKFLLSDNPACLFSPVAEIAFNNHIIDKMFVQEPFSGYMLFIPLSPTMGFLCFDDDYYRFDQEICIEATKDDVNTLNTIEVMNSREIILYQDGSFSPESIIDVLATRNTEKRHIHQNTIYTPIESNFTLTGLNINENEIIYLINRYAIEKRRNGF
ncbi:MAG: DUF4238 domain-containing protein [Bacteroidaceae bacterium]|nr:DUF4238 domain-containing protein [Bacteroidaceae bacterium]